MKTKKELHAVLSAHRFHRVDAHVHTHLCDGAEDMTVERIADQAVKRGMTAVVLTPHFHKQVKDETAVLYTDTDPRIFLALREEIDAYTKKNGDRITLLLSAEADILSVDGATSLELSREAEEALDLVTPTVNYHPCLPLKAVEVTYGKRIASIHSEGLYGEYARAAGGVERVLEILYETEANAVLKSPYPCMLGHFFAAHSHAKEKYNWFGAEERHVAGMKSGAEKVLDACARAEAMIDLTGIHHSGESVWEKQRRDGFFFDFQKWFLARCGKKGILALPGSDSHKLASVGETEYYRSLMTDLC